VSTKWFCPNVSRPNVSRPNVFWPKDVKPFHRLRQCWVWAGRKCFWPPTGLSPPPLDTLLRKLSISFASSVFAGRELHSGGSRIGAATLGVSTLGITALGVTIKNVEIRTRHTAELVGWTSKSDLSSTRKCDPIHVSDSNEFGHT